MATNTSMESGENKESQASQETVREDEALNGRYDLSDDSAADLVAEDAKSPVEYNESDADTWIRDNIYWDELRTASWNNGEFLKNFVSEMLLSWSQDRESLEEIKLSFKLEDFAGGFGELFIGGHITADRYYFDFNFVRDDGTSKKYSLNFVRRKDIVEIGGDVKAYLEQIVEKEARYATRKEKPWHESGDA